MVSAGRLLGLLAGVAIAGASGPLVVGAGLVTAAGSPPGPHGPHGDVRPTEAALVDIPAPVLAVYREAAGQCPGSSWALLAGIGKIESDHGRIFGASVDPQSFDVNPPIIGIALDGRPGIAAIGTPPEGSRWHGDLRWDHAVGPMQFITGTWQAWGVDANGDGVADPHNFADAAFSAARYLCGGAPRLDNVEAALLRYNHSAEYVEAVLEWAERYAAADTVLSMGAGVVLPVVAQKDLAAGRVDRRVVALLRSVGASYEVEVSVLVSGHAQCVGGGDRTARPDCSVSNHWHGRAVDISAVDGLAVSTENLAARRLLEQLLALPEGARPTEIGGPWGDVPDVFTDAGHQDHLHIGWDD